MPNEIASFLNLPQARGHIGYCLRKSFTSLLANTETDLLTIKRHGGWWSNDVCNGEKTALKFLGKEKMKL